MVWRSTHVDTACNSSVTEPSTLPSLCNVMPVFLYPTQLAQPSEWGDSIDWLATGACTFFASLGPLLFGFDVGVTPGAVRAIIAEQLSSGNWSDTIALECNLLPSISLCGALVSSLVLMLLGNMLGRRQELILAAVIYGLSATLCQFSENLIQLLILRGLYGVGMGLSMHSAASYIAETCPESHRGSLICLKESMLVVGIMKGYLASSIVGASEGAWKQMYSAAMPVALIMLLGMAFLPESPRWLLLYHWRKAILSFRASSSAKRQSLPDGHQRELVSALLEMPSGLSHPLLVPPTAPPLAPQLTSSSIITLHPTSPSLSTPAWPEYRSYTNSAESINIQSEATLEMKLPVIAREQAGEQLLEDQEEVLRATGRCTDLVEDSGPNLTVIRDDEYQHCNQEVETSSITIADELRWRWLWQQQGLVPGDIPASDVKGEEEIGPLGGPGRDGEPSDRHQEQQVMTSSAHGGPHFDMRHQEQQIMTSSAHGGPHFDMRHQEQQIMTSSAHGGPHFDMRHQEQQIMTSSAHGGPHFDMRHQEQQVMTSSAHGGPHFDMRHRLEERVSVHKHHPYWPAEGRAPYESISAVTAEAGFSACHNITSVVLDCHKVLSEPNHVTTQYSTAAASRALPVSYLPTPSTDGLTPLQRILLSELPSESASACAPLMSNLTRHRSGRRLPSFGASSSSSAPTRWRNLPGPGPAKAKQALTRAWGRRATGNPMLVEREMAKMTVSAREASLYDETVGTLRLVTAIIAAVTVDVWGRRPLLLVGATGVVLSLTALALTEWSTFAEMLGATNSTGWVSASAMILFLVSFQLSFAPISWLYCGEIFPLAVRGCAVAAADLAGCFSSLAVNMLLPSLHRSVGSLGTYIVFVMFSLVAVLGVYCSVPETKGMTLEEIELFWGGDNMPSFETVSLSEWLP
ncbi:hypothetical protein CEUSTIGMA_g2787.t1 [Chlamydomonas eustigma]|uniref:Major facilitator superfamily (MFS) profile domain-containing protein n=1 Tax=Chlamydomonas eustigma TaxID=1157962 RepID=A0A250WXJ2_9CHLO|nr:hypothetical protein CEUSTIGMA_g2787.t1 [Chlamydomonas eustigma]|eukprot:GAX75342.1 hypothetical protein CEUSTIGMA_g2787.t1 [Chlamydomonas eustigma]